MIIFRTNGGKDSGLGHMMRCLSLAKALSAKCPEEVIIFRANNEMRSLILENNFGFQPSENYNEADAEDIKRQKPKMILFDSYLGNNDYLRKIKQNSFLVQFDDNNDIYTPIAADIIINGNIHALSLHYNVGAGGVSTKLMKLSERKLKYLPPAKVHLGQNSQFNSTRTQKLLLGPKYLIMREEYQGYIEEKEGNGIMITTGGADFLNLMPQFIKSLRDTEYKKTIIIGPAFIEEEIEEIKQLTDGNRMFELVYKPKSLKKHILASEIVITAAASTVYEVLRLKKIPVIYTLADNQKKIEAALRERQVVSLGNYKGIIFEKEFMVEKIEEAKKNENNISDLYDIFDGEGVFRIVEGITNFLE